MRHSYQVYLAEQDRKPIPVAPKLNPVDAFQNDAFSPMSAFGAIELKASEFDDGGPSALSSAQPVTPSSPPADSRNGGRASRFLPKKTDSTQAPLSPVVTAPLRPESSVGTPMRARRERSASTKNLFDSLGFNQRGNRQSKEIMTSENSTVQTPTMPHTPSSAGLFSFAGFGKKQSSTAMSKTSSASNSSAELNTGVNLNFNSETSRASIVLLALDKNNTDKASIDKSSFDKCSIDKVSVEQTSDAAISNPSISNSAKSSEVAL